MSRRSVSFAALGGALSVVLLALVGPWLGVGSPDMPVGGPFQPSGRGHLLGTDVLGRDVLARVLVGGRTMVVQACAATLAGSVIGLSIGVWAGTTHRSRPARAVLSLVDGIAAVPALLLLLVLAAGAPGNDLVLTWAIALVSVPFSVRITREQTQKLAASDYAREAQARGDAWLTRIRGDILPGLAPVALAEAGIRFVAATQLAATAGFLGLGSPAPSANWGRMVRENITGLAANPLPVLVPAALVVVVGVGVTAVLDRAAGARLTDLARASSIAPIRGVARIRRLA